MLSRALGSCPPGQIIERKKLFPHPLSFGSYLFLSLHLISSYFAFPQHAPRRRKLKKCNSFAFLWYSFDCQLFCSVIWGLLLQEHSDQVRVPPPTCLSTPSRFMIRFCSKERKGWSKGKGGWGRDSGGHMEETIRKSNHSHSPISFKITHTYIYLDYMA